MRVRSLRPALIAILGASPVLAAPATPDVARQLEQSYADYLGRAAVESGVVKVAPQGDDYVVVWDLEKGAELIGADPGAFHAATFAYRLTPTGDGAWRLAADAFPTMTFDAPTDAGRFSANVELSGFSLQGVYDPAQAEFLRAEIGVDAAHVKNSVVDSKQNTAGDLVETGIKAEARAKSADSGGVDLACVQRIAGMTETVVSGPVDGSAPATLTYTVGAGTGEATLTGLRAAAIAEAWKYVVAHLDQPAPGPEFDAKLRAALPLWTDFKGVGELNDFALSAPFGHAKLTRLSETVSLSGLTSLASAEFGLKFDGLSLDAPAAPAWTAKLIPASIDFDLKFSGGGFDKAAEIVLEDSSFAASGDLSTEAQDKIAAALLAGDPKLILAPGRLTTPVLDLAFEGDLSATGGAPRGRLTITADSLDKALDLMRDAAASDPEAQTAIVALTYAKGLAKTLPDGRLGWTIEVSGSEVTVNGSPLPSGK